MDFWLILYRLIIERFAVTRRQLQYLNHIYWMKEEVGVPYSKVQMFIGNYYWRVKPFPSYPIL